MNEPKIVVKLFEESLIDLMKFHYQNDYPFDKEADVQSYLFMKLFEKLENKNLLFKKDGSLTLRSGPKYPFKRGSKKFDLGIISPSFEEVDKKGSNIPSSDYKYIIATEIKLWFSSRDIRKLSKLLEQGKTENCYFVLLDERWEPAEELLTPKDTSSKFYQISPNNLISKSKIKVFYSFIFKGQKGIDAERFDLISKNNVTVLTKKGVIKNVE